MNFASIEFWQTLVACFLISRVLIYFAGRIRPQAYETTAKLSLIGTALTLLAVESWLTLVAFLWVVCLGWFSLIVIHQKWRSSSKQLAIIILLIGQIAPLFYFKYWDFFFNEVLKLNVHIPSVLIPMGLSFYTFQTIGFWVDSLREKAPRPSFIDYLNFASFFPQIVAGPIERRDDLLPQISNTRFRFYRENLEPALPWIVLGLAYKLIVADNIAIESANFTVNPNNPWQVWIECLTFGMRIYFDFAGYSFIAIGLGLLFGVKLTLNFRTPYLSSNLREFWRNWHITLGSWLRDYIYLPLGGRKVRWWAINLLFVFFVSGIWHGAGWGFLVWGILHGLGVAACGFIKLPRYFRIPSIIITFLFCNAVWLFFFERNTAIMWQKATSLINPAAYQLSALKQCTAIFSGAGNQISSLLIIFFAIAALTMEALGLARNKEPYHYLRTQVSCLILVALTVWFAPMQEAPFIYFNF